VEIYPSTAIVAGKRVLDLFPAAGKINWRSRRRTRFPAVDPSPLTFSVLL
jgi:hypothetical protein